MWILFFVFTGVFAYTVISDNPDYYYNEYWFAPDEVWAKDTATGFWHDFYFPPNTQANFNYIRSKKLRGLNVQIDYRLNNDGERIIFSVL